CVQATHWPYSF
nr:immunoglobulin light chain junction region [Macaca mulatta]